jgi:hypothetical protein
MLFSAAKQKGAIVDNRIIARMIELFFLPKFTITTPHSCFAYYHVTDSIYNPYAEQSYFRVYPVVIS